jgi:hypothetical protein
MAIATDHFVNTTGVTSGSPITVTSSTGNLCIVCVTFGQGNVVSSVVDSKGNSYVSAGINSNTSARALELWYAANASTGITTVTVTFAGVGGFATIAIYDCSGADASNPLSAYSQGNFLLSATTNPVGPSVSVSTGGGIIIAFLGPAGSAIPTAIGGSFTLDAAGGGYGFVSNLNSGSGTFTPSWTINSSQQWTGITAGFKSTPGVSLLVVQDVKGVTPLAVASTKLNNLLVACVFVSSGGAVSGVTDNASGGTNTYTRCTNSVSTSSVCNIEIWYAVGIRSGATSITVVFSSGSSLGVELYEISGADTVAPFDVANHANNQTAGTSGPPFKMANPSLTINFSREIIIACEGNANGLLAPYVDDPFVCGATPDGFGASRVVIATGTYNASWDSDTSADSYNASLASFILASTPVAAINQGYGAVVQDDMIWLGGDQE